MPALNYQERFVPFVKDGSKPHTIRARRKHPIKAGDMLYHYTGMRTKHCQKIAEDKCLTVCSILITADGNVAIFKKRIEVLPDTLMELIQNKCDLLSYRDCDRLAWQDGFRPEGSSFDNCKGCFDVMLRWWRLTHQLPFLGDIIYRDL